MSTETSHDSSIKLLTQTLDFCEKLPNLLGAIEHNPISISALYREILEYLRIKEKILDTIKDDVKQIKAFLERDVASHYKKGREYLDAASKTKQNDVKNHSVRRAIDEFKDCAHKDSPAFAIEALFLQGVCYEMLSEHSIAMDYYKQALHQSEIFDAQLSAVQIALNESFQNGAAIGAVGGASIGVVGVAAISSLIFAPIVAGVMAAVYGLGGGAVLGGILQTASKDREIVEKLRIDPSKLGEYQEKNLKLIAALKNLVGRHV